MEASAGAFVSSLLDPSLAVEQTPAPSRHEILDRLDRGEITPQEAVEAPRWRHTGEQRCEHRAGCHRQ